jgi:uncharacterized delta-60 repeat protein
MTMLAPKQESSKTEATLSTGRALRRVSRYSRCPLGVSARIVESLEQRRLLSSGALDLTFGTGGLVTTPSAASIRAIRLQPDGKILALAGTTAAAQLIIRYLPDGSVDTSFGINGFVSGPAGGPVQIGLQSDGKILALNSNFVLARYLPNGTPDGTFGTNGQMTCWIGAPDENHLATDMYIVPDDRIYAAGWCEYKVSMQFWRSAFVLSTVDPNGQTFGGGTENLGDGYREGAATFGTQPDGKFILAGNATETATGTTYASVRRFNANGSADNTFRSGGNALVWMPHSSTVHVAGQSDGKVVVAGTSVDGYDASFWFTRLSATGWFDGTFGTAGSTTVDFGSNLEDLTELAIDQSNRIVAGGWSNFGTAARHDFALTRLTVNGQIDGTFGTNGRVRTDFSQSWDQANDMAIQPNGRIILAGGEGARLARYLATPLVGDADDNGVIDFNDYVLIDNGFNNGLSGWANGDFNEDGVVDFDDFVLIDLAFNSQP